MSDPASIVASLSDSIESIMNTKIPTDYLWYFTFYGTIVSALIPTFHYGSRFYIFVMNSIYLMFGEDFNAMIDYWGSIFAEPVRYL
jgi:hypothetical protein